MCLQFAVLYEARANTGIDRMKIINLVAKSVPEPHKVDLNNPDKTIIVQVAKVTVAILHYKYGIFFNKICCICHECNLLQSFSMYGPFTHFPPALSLRPEDFVIERKIVLIFYASQYFVVWCDTFSLWKREKK